MRRILFALLFAAVCCLASCALAEDTLQLPADLTTIEAEAFYGDTSLERVVLGSKVFSIGKLAFANSSLERINLPGSLMSIAPDAFSGCKNLIVTASEGTYAYAWAMQYGLNVETITAQELTLTVNGVAYNEKTPMTLYVGDKLSGTLSGKISGGTTLYVYSSNPASVSVTQNGTSVTVTALKDTDAVLYASTVQAQSVSQIPKDALFKLCDVQLPVYRAVVIGQTYEGNYYGISELPACGNDAAMVQTMLKSMKKTNYQVSKYLDQTKSGMLSAISSVLGQADDNDVSFFYYSGHGASSDDASYLGALVGVNRTYLTVSELRTALDKVKGKKIVMLDSCHSGAFIGKGGVMVAQETEPNPQAFNSSVISAFSANARANLATSEYYVITAARSVEYSYSIGSINAGAFTHPLCVGSGWGRSDLPADKDGNSLLSLKEVYDYAYAGALQYVDQYAQVYPNGGSPFVVWGK